MKEPENVEQDIKKKPYKHPKTRPNIPSVGLAPDGEIPNMPETNYYYSPHLDPILRTANTDAVLPLPVLNLLNKAQRESLTNDEVQQLVDALQAQPWLEWTNKREEGVSFNVDPVPLFMHEEIDAEAMLETAKCTDDEPGLFPDSQLNYLDAVEFYEHEVPWKNRLILGDSLQVMDSLMKRESLVGSVQMIYMDPPYGIDFNSNFQTNVFKTNVGKSNSNKDMTREIEQIKAYNDTWKHGVHSYLSYLRERFVVARRLLKDSGSIFVQIGAQNCHRVRCLLDEVFKPENFVAEIVLRTRSTSTSKYLSTLNDFILWYAKDINLLKFHPLYLDKELEKRFTKAELPTGEVISASSEKTHLKKAKYFTSSSLFSTSGNDETAKPFVFRNKTYKPKSNRGWRCSLKGLEKLAKAERIIPHNTNMGYKYYFSDFPFTEISNFWNEQLSEVNKIYVVQTSPKAVQRCMLMSTDPGDLVLDPTCGSGTTAYVAEQWGRRWITIDTSRIAISLARTRLLTATYDYYKVKDASEGITSGFVLKTAPHIQLKDIVNNIELEQIFEKHEPILLEKLSVLNTALEQVTPEIRKELQQKLASKNARDLTDAERRCWDLPKTNWEEWEVPFDTDPLWPETLQDALYAFRKAWREKMDDVNTCIAARAKQELLVDQPEIEKKRIRVSGPFTVESVQPQADSVDTESKSEPTNAAVYLELMFSQLKEQGFDYQGKLKHFMHLDYIGGDLFHAEGIFEDDDREVGVVFSAQHGIITAFQVENCLREARRQYDVVLFVGFDFEPEAQSIIDRGHPKIETHKAYTAPNLVMSAHLKQTQSDRFFTVVGSPNTSVIPIDGKFKVIMSGLNTYNPINNTVESTLAEDVVAWFIDRDYNGRTFCPRYSFFPKIETWRNIAKSFKTMINEDLWEVFTGTESPLFSAGKHKCIAVKVIDRHGHELMSVHALGDLNE